MKTTTLNKPKTLEILNKWLEEMDQITYNLYFLQLTKHFNEETTWELSELLEMKDEYIDFKVVERILKEYRFKTFEDLKNYSRGLINKKYLTIVRELRESEGLSPNSFSVFSHIEKQTLKEEKENTKQLVSTVGEYFYHILYEENGKEFDYLLYEDRTTTKLMEVARDSFLVDYEHKNNLNYGETDYDSFYMVQEIYMNIFINQFPLKVK